MGMRNDRQNAFRERKRREGMRAMEIWLTETEIEAVDRVKIRLGINSRSEALQLIISSLGVTSDTMLVQGMAK